MEGKDVPLGVEERQGNFGAAGGGNAAVVNYPFEQQIYVLDLVLIDYRRAVVQILAVAAAVGEDVALAAPLLLVVRLYIDTGHAVVAEEEDHRMHMH